MIIEERGIFWEAENTCADDQWMPPKIIYGTIFVDDDGAIKLELDGFLCGIDSFESFDNHVRNPYRNIIGITKNSNQTIYIPNALAVGATKAQNGISHERFIGLYCLVMKGHPHKLICHAINIDKISMSADSYGELFEHKSIRFRRTEDSINVSWKSSSGNKFSFSDRNVNIYFEMSAPFWPESNLSSVEMRIIPKIDYIFNRKVDISQAAKEHRKFFDLLFLLSRVKRNIDWPVTECIHLKTRAVLYYMREKIKEEKYQLHNSWYYIEEVDQNFKNLLKNWIEKSEDLGPAFYLFLSANSDRETYQEQKFIILVTGMETLHRLTLGSRKDDKILNKIDRIITKVDDKDKRWLTQILHRNAEPNLGHRLFELIYPVLSNQLQLDIKRFCNDCREIRNNLVHFGSIARKGEGDVSN